MAEIVWVETGHGVSSAGRKIGNTKLWLWRWCSIPLGAAIASLFSAHFAQAQNATWTGAASSEWTVGTNWSSTPNIPSGTATFTTGAAITNVNNNNVVSIAALMFSAPSAYTFGVNRDFTVTGAGIVNNSTSEQTFNVNGTMQFQSGSADSGSGAVKFNVASTGFLYFLNSSTGGNATINNNNGFLAFLNSSTAGGATIINTSNNNASGGFTFFVNSSTAGSATITNNGYLQFLNNSSAGNATITNNLGLQFSDNSSAGGATITNNFSLAFINHSTAGNATIHANETVSFLDSSTAGNAVIIDKSFLVFNNNSTGGDAVITNNHYLAFTGNSTAGNAVITNNGTFALQFDNNSTGGNATITNTGTSAIDFSNTTGPHSDRKLSVGSLAGPGDFYLGANQLTVGSNDLSTTISGVISDCGNSGAQCLYAILVGPTNGGSLMKTGNGTLTLSGINTYTGATNVNAGTLSVNGSIASSSLTTVNPGATLGGNGIVGNTLINGGTLSPGNSIGLLTVQGSLVFTAAASYMVEVSPGNADRVNVTGAATLGGATLKANFAPGAYVSKQYTILNATGGVAGTFNSFVTTNLPSNFSTSLGYDTHNAFLNLTLNFSIPGGLTGNQQNVGNALANFFNSTGGIPLAFAALSPASLTQAAGETATGSQQTTFSAMTQFITTLLDPFVAGRIDGSAPAGAMPFAEEGDANAYASAGRQHSGAEREAYAAIANKVPPRIPSFEARWSVWAAGFGGSQTTDSNTTLGSNNTTSRVFGMAAGADYVFSAFTIAGFALAGGGTNFGVVNGGSGRSDLFQAGGFVRHTIGAAYISGALAYGWQDITTDRTVTIAGADRLRAQFNANAYSGRAEGGYRFATPWTGVGLTPYAAAQFTTFDLPAYAEQVLSGANTFALGYTAKSVTATRSELGIRTDKTFAMQDAILTLRGRVAWAHDYNNDRNIAATFQTLPGPSFVVNGAAQASDAALITGSAEVKWRNGFSLAGTFEGEFSNVTRSYAGKAVARYAW